MNKQAEKFLIFAENVSKTFDLGETRVRALDSISFGLRKREYVSIMGPSGSGKTTLLDVLSCMLRPTTFEKETGLRQSVEIKGEKFKIVGVLKTNTLSSGFGTNIVWMPKDTVKKMFAESNPTELAVIVAEGANPKETAEKIERRLEIEHGEKSVSVLTPENILSQVTGLLGAVQAVVLAIGTISLLVGAIGITNTMIVNVLQRRREIGIMKAVGATNSQIMSIFVAEAAIIGFTGGLIGTILGTATALGITIIADNTGFPLSFYLDPFLALFGILFGMTVSIVSGIIPAITAAKMEPVEALKFEN